MCATTLGYVNVSLKATGSYSIKIALQKAFDVTFFLRKRFVNMLGRTILLNSKAFMYVYCTIVHTYIYIKSLFKRGNILNIRFLMHIYSFLFNAFEQSLKIFFKFVEVP